MHNRFCFLDLETTGFDAEKDSIIEVAILIYDGKEKIEELDQVCTPEKTPITPFITNITDITPAEISEKGVKFQTLKNSINELIGDRVIIGHNIDFDINFLAANGIDIARNPRIDTHELARILLINEESYALEILSKKYGWEHTDAHRAMADVRVSIELFYFLQQKIRELPVSFLDTIRPILKQKTDWHARHLFFSLGGTDGKNFSRPKKPEKNTPSATFTDPVIEKISLPKKGSPIFFRPKNSPDGKKQITALAEKFSAEKKVLLITPCIDFFPDFPAFPTPYVLIDSDRLQDFSQKRTRLNDAEITFFLKVAYRDFLGFRGKDFFDLFFQERSFWSEVCIEDEKNPRYQQIVKEKSAKNILTITPRAFFDLRHLEIFSDRVILVDEAENLGSLLLFHPLKKTVIEGEDMAVDFFIARFVRDFFEPHIGHSVGAFGEKAVFLPTQSIPQWIEELKKNSIGNAEILSDFKHASDEKKVRFAEFFPYNGALSFSTWDPTEWLKIQQDLAEFPAVFIHRNSFQYPETVAFFRIFIGQWEGEKIESEPAEKIFPTVPESLSSPTSSDYHTGLAQQISNASKDFSDTDMAVFFTSIETMRSVYDELEKFNISHEIFGEKLAGGDGKFAEKVKQCDHHARMVFLQKMISPFLSTLPVSVVMIQKIPFPVPHPILDSLAKNNPHISLWDSWIVPQVVFGMRQRLAIFPRAQKIFLLDARVHAPWAKDLLRKVFS